MSEAELKFVDDGIVYNAKTSNINLADFANSSDAVKRIFEHLSDAVYHEWRKKKKLAGEESVCLKCDKDKER